MKEATVAHAPSVKSKSMNEHTENLMSADECEYYCLNEALSV